jgi:hypothetical protein
MAKRIKLEKKISKQAKSHGPAMNPDLRDQNNLDDEEGDK